MEKLGLKTDPDSDITNKETYFDEDGKMRPGGVDASKLQLVPEEVNLGEIGLTDGSYYTGKYEYKYLGDPK